METSTIAGKLVRALIFSFTLLGTAFFVNDSKAQVYTQNFNTTLGGSGWTNNDLTVPWGNGSVLGISNVWQNDDQESGQAQGVCGAAGSGNPSLYMGSTLGGGAAYLADANTNRRIGSPDISSVGYTSLVLSFNFISEGEANTDKAYFQYSIDGGVNWISPLVSPTSAVPALQTGASLNNLKSSNGACAPQGTWTHVTWNMPVTCEGIANLRVGFVWQCDNNSAGTDPAVAIDDVIITGTATSTNTIATGTITGSPFCSCAAVTVPFTSVGTFTAGNTYSAQLSSSTGSFAAPVSIGTLGSTANSGNISATIPCNTPSGTAYRIRVVSDTPPATGTDNGVDITITQSLTAAATISANPGIVICPGTSVTFTAVNTNGISSPDYQWHLNGTPVGTNVNTYTNAGLVAGDSISCIISSAGACVIGSPAYSNILIISNSPSIPAAVSISASQNPICPGNSVTLTAINTNGIPTPTYTWHLNGSVVGSNSATYTSSALANGDTLTCIISSPSPCVTGSPAYSNMITMSVGNVPAAVSIAADLNPICTGTTVTFTATNTNNIPSPVYQWKLNGTPVGGGGTTYTNGGLANGDQIICVISSVDPCVVGSPATSNTVIMTVANSLLAGINITIPPITPAPLTDTICAGATVNFTATPSNGGPTPVYQWFVGATPVGVNSPNYSSSTLTNGNVITCVMNSSFACATGNPASSNSITIVVDPGGPATAVITASPSGQICPGTSVTFTCTGTNLGNNPTYQWQINGVNTGTGLSTYTNAGLANTDIITCIVTSSSACATGSPVTSNSIVMDVATAGDAYVHITGPLTICSGDPGVFSVDSISNEGLTPFFQWQKNGSAVGTSWSGYTDNSLVSGDSIDVVLVSSATCLNNNTSLSNIMHILVEDCPKPVSALIVSKKVLCVNDCISFQDSSYNNPVTWDWTFVGGDPASYSGQFPPQVCFHSTGTYNVGLKTTNARGDCDSTFVGLIFVSAPVVMNAGEDVEIQKGNSAPLAASGGNMFLWSPPNGLSCTECSSPTASPTETTTYIVTDTLACGSSDTVIVKVYDKFEVFVPNAFSPNGDGQNDLLFVRGNGIQSIDFVVYDRLGEKVFASISADTGWDGNFRGKTMNPGVFTYYVRATFIDGSEKSLKGNVTMFK